jgi:predicted DNA-binding ribbon-helix-helix protein
MSEGRMPRFLQTLDQSVFDRLNDMAKERGVSIQELIRAVIVPEWLESKKK